jgi:hypothetical protein
MYVKLRWGRARHGGFKSGFFLAHGGFKAPAAKTRIPLLPLCKGFTPQQPDARPDFKLKYRREYGQPRGAPPGNATEFSVESKSLKLPF